MLVDDSAQNNANSASGATTTTSVAGTFGVPRKPAALDDPEAQEYVNYLVGATRREATERASANAERLTLEKYHFKPEDLEELQTLRKGETDRVLAEQQAREDQLRKQQKFEELLAAKAQEYQTGINAKDNEIASLKTSLATERDARKKDRLSFAASRAIAAHASEIFEGFMPYLESDMLSKLTFEANGDSERIVILLDGAPVSPEEFVATTLRKNPFARKQVVSGGSGIKPVTGDSVSLSKDAELLQKGEELLKLAQQGDRDAQQEYAKLRPMLLKAKAELKKEATTG